MWGQTTANSSTNTYGLFRIGAAESVGDPHPTWTRVACVSPRIKLTSRNIHLIVIGLSELHRSLKLCRKDDLNVKTTTTTVTAAVVAMIHIISTHYTSIVPSVSRIYVLCSWLALFPFLKRGGAAKLHVISTNHLNIDWILFCSYERELLYVYLLLLLV